MSEAQGVVQRVIDEYSQLFRDAHAKGAYPEMKYNAEAIDALHRMHKAMSAEARRVLADIRTNRASDNRPDDNYQLGYQDGFSGLARVLGLDLSEPEDSDE